MAEVMLLPEVAALLRCGQSTVRRMMARGELKYFKIGSDFRFNRADVDEFRFGGQQRQTRNNEALAG